MADAAHQQTDADNAVTHDHHRGEHRIARKTGFLGTGREHHRDDQRNLDHRDGHGQHQRAERFADPVGDHLRVMHGGEHGAGQRDADQRQQHAITGQCISAHRE